MKVKGQLCSLYRTWYAKPVAGQTFSVSAVQTVARHSVFVREPYNPTPIGGKRVGMQADAQHDALKRQRLTGNLAEGVPQTHMSSPTHVSTPLHQILVLTIVTTSLQKPFHVEL